MQVKSPNLQSSQLKDVELLIAEMLVDTKVTGDFIGSIVSAVGSAATDVGHAVASAATDVASFATAHKTAVADVATDAIEAAAETAAVAIAARPVIMQKHISTTLQSNKVQALSLQKLIALRQEALN